MAKASINFQKYIKGGVFHNDRSKSPDYLLPAEHRLQNEVDRSAVDASKMISDLYAEARENYRQKFGQKLQSKSYLWEAVVNLNKEHRLEDVQRLVKEIEKETGFTSVQIAIHRDEGRIERGVPIRNFHAHITFFTLCRSSGEQLYRRQVTNRQKERGLKPMNRSRLSKLQDLTAEVLGMERGKRGSKAVRLDHKTYKQEAKKQQQQLAKNKDLKSLIALFREDLKRAQAKRAQYAALEQIQRELREQIKNRELTIEHLRDELDSLKDRLLNQDTAIEKIKKITETSTIWDAIQVIEQIPKRVDQIFEKIERLEKKQKTEQQNIFNDKDLKISRTPQAPLIETDFDAIFGSLEGVKNERSVSKAIKDAEEALNRLDESLSAQKQKTKPKPKPNYPKM